MERVDSHFNMLKNLIPNRNYFTAFSQFKGIGYEVIYSKAQPTREKNLLCLTACWIYRVVALLKYNIIPKTRMTPRINKSNKC